MVLGDLGSVLGDPGRVLVNFWRIFWGPGGRKKKAAFPESKLHETFRNQVFPSKNRKSMLNSWFYWRKTIIISNFPNPKKICFFCYCLAGPGSGRPAPGPGSRAGPGNIEKHGKTKKIGRPGRPARITEFPCYGSI